MTKRKNVIIYLTMVSIMIIFGGSRCDEDSATAQKNKGEGMGQTAQAVFAGGCFWCTEAGFEKVPGVQKVVSGYTGGTTENPDYQSVCTGKTGHYEAVLVTYDPQTISYPELIQKFFRQIDPTDATGAFCDRGSQYAPAIFYKNEQEKASAEESLNTLAASGKFDVPLQVKVLPLGTFYPADEYHQDFHKKSPDRYYSYRSASGRDEYIQQVWGASCEKPPSDSLKSCLTDLQYTVTQENGTEQPFKNEYWDKEEEGIYVDVVSGEPLFSSEDKFKSGTGWPSFTKPLNESALVEKKDSSHGMERIEVRSAQADSHLGHLFYDGPLPSRKRYCINSAALRFISKKKLDAEKKTQ